MDLLLGLISCEPILKCCSTDFCCGAFHGYFCMFERTCWCSKGDRERFFQDHYGKLTIMRVLCPFCLVGVFLTFFGVLFVGILMLSISPSVDCHSVYDDNCSHTGSLLLMIFGILLLVFGGIFFIFIFPIALFYTISWLILWILESFGIVIDSEDYVDRVLEMEKRKPPRQCGCISVQASHQELQTTTYTDANGNVQTNSQYVTVITFWQKFPVVSSMWEDLSSLSHSKEEQQTFDEGFVRLLFKPSVVHDERESTYISELEEQFRKDFGHLDTTVLIHFEGLKCQPDKINYYYKREQADPSQNLSYFERSMLKSFWNNPISCCCCLVGGNIYLRGKVLQNGFHDVDFNLKKKCLDYYCDQYKTKSGDPINIGNAQPFNDHWKQVAIENVPYPSQKKNNDSGYIRFKEEEELV